MMPWSAHYQVFKECDVEHRSLEDTQQLGAKYIKFHWYNRRRKNLEREIKLAKKSRMRTFTAVVSATSRAASPAFAKRLTQPAHNQSLWSHKTV
jgi:hypothetical protein